MIKHFVKIFRNLPIFKDNTPRHLGRWRLDDKQYLKVDYANMDSCGDILCGKPDHFKPLNNNNKITHQ